MNSGPRPSAQIEVEKKSEGLFVVRVRDQQGQTSHEVTLNPRVQQRLTEGKTAPEQLIRASFEFLLEREPKESILPQFQLAVIGRYFPEYESEIRKRLQIDVRPS